MNQTKNIILLVQDSHKLDKLDSTPHCYNINTLLSHFHSHSSRNFSIPADLSTWSITTKYYSAIGSFHKLAINNSPPNNTDKDSDNDNDDNDNENGNTLSSIPFTRVGAIVYFANPLNVQTNLDTLNILDSLSRAHNVDVLICVSFNTQFNISDSSESNSLCGDTTMNDDDILEDYCIENNWEYISYHSHFPSENGDSGENDNNDDEYTTPSTSLPSFSTEPLLTNIDINTNTSTNTNNTSLPSCTCKLTLSKKTTKIVTDDVCIEFCTHTANQIISSLINTDIWVSTLDDSEKSSLSMSGLLIDDKFDVCQENSSNTDNQKSKPKPQPQPQPQSVNVNENENENENKNKIDPSNDKDVDSDSDSDKDQDTEWSEFMTFQDSDDLANLTNFIKQSRDELSTLPREKRIDRAAKLAYLLSDKFF